MRAPSASALLLFPALLLGTWATPLGAQESGHRKHDDADHAVPGGGTVPAGWTARADDNGGITNVKVVPMGKGMHVTLGPAVVLYRDNSAGKGPFHTLATFTQTKPTPHAEGYGLFYGGEGLDGAGQKYTYFLVRQDGTYLVKQRDGDKTTEISKGWVASPAVHKIEGKGSATNLLEIDHKSDPSKFVFKVNGEPVHTMDAGSSNADGVVGIRANHHLDLHIDGFDVHR